jgi:hypothetical protein
VQNRLVNLGLAPATAYNIINLILKGKREKIIITTMTIRTEVAYNAAISAYEFSGGKSYDLNHLGRTL